jgi:hypothetical protein
LKELAINGSANRFFMIKNESENQIEYEKAQRGYKIAYIRK